MQDMISYQLAKSHMAELQAEAAEERLARGLSPATSPAARNGLIVGTLLRIGLIDSLVLRLAKAEVPTPRSTSAPCR